MLKIKELLNYKKRFKYQRHKAKRYKKRINKLEKQLNDFTTNEEYLNNVDATYKCLLVDRNKNTAELEFFCYSKLPKDMKIVNKKKHKNYEELNKEIKEFIRKENNYSY